MFCKKKMHSVMVARLLTAFKPKDQFGQNNLTAFLLAAVLVFSIVQMPISYAKSLPDSPLKQTQRGVLATDIKCADGLVLVFKASDLSPICVQQSSAQILITRGWAIENGNTYSESNSTILREYNLALLANSDSPQYNDTLATFVKSLKSGDYLMVEGYDGPTSVIEQKIHNLESLVSPGVNVGAIRIYNSIDQLTNMVPNLPKGFDYIGYDYEDGKSFSPEFTTNENTAIGYFDKAKSAVEQYNLKTGGDAKLIIMPPYGELREAGWDWGLAAKHTDIIDIQFQAFIKDAKFLNYVLNAISQIKKESPTTKVFVQLSLVPKRGTAQDNLNAIGALYKLPIDAFLMFYHPNQTSDLKQFFQIMPK